MSMDAYSLYEQERTDPKLYICPAPGEWLHDQHGNWNKEEWQTCSTCGGTGTIPAKDWDEVD